jgi:signal transduction histidine kinase
MSGLSEQSTAITGNRRHQSGMAHPVGGMSPLSHSARWQPQRWRLRTRLIALTIVPLALALVLGAVLVVRTAKDSSVTAIGELVVIGAVSLLALMLLVAVARSILRPVRVLHASAVDVADRRLPAAIELLRTSDGRSGSVEVQRVPVHSGEDLVGQVARAFDTVYREAVRLATEQAALRANVNSLVERQLRLVGELELGEQDGATGVAALVRLDHLAARMRRNGENLLVLAGAGQRQRGGDPVAVLDVLLRAAGSEIEDYQRVTVQPVPHAKVVGPVVSDVVHLVAELLENATSYSNPESQVTLGARMTDYGGLLIEICDEGTGDPHARPVEIDQRLSAPPPVDVHESRQMGLLVPAELASRHGITVELMPAEGSGVRVTVTLPPQLVSSGTSGGQRC